MLLYFFFAFCYNLGMSFSLKLLKKESLKKALTEMQIETLSEVQQECIPDLLSASSVRILSPAGSGKTLTYLLPLLDRMEVQKGKKHLPVMLVLVPTRELALQTADVCRRCLKYTEGIRTAVLTGGVGIDAQIRSFHNGADIVIATPARLLDHIRRHTFRSKALQDVVLDEADRMADMGFLSDVQAVYAQIPSVRTICLSATEDARLDTLAEQYFPDAVMHHITHSVLLHQDIRFQIVHVKKQYKLQAAAEILKQSQDAAIVFCNTRRMADQLVQNLHKNHISSAALHSEMDPAVRRKTMQDYRSGKCRVLAATDVLSRGIDVTTTALVLLYDMPSELNDLIHRIGRTARGGQSGTVCILQCGKTDPVFAAYCQKEHPEIEEFQWNPR